MGLFGIKKISLEFDAINNCVDSRINKRPFLSADSENYGLISIVNENPSDDVLLHVFSKFI